ncbi:MAG: hypothetical protein LBI18_08250, partial [Planctomycetaceae bacterium]|nr:hypothetical protein [Planctomycetaceae bacterium]
MSHAEFLPQNNNSACDTLHDHQLQGGQPFFSDENAPFLSVNELFLSVNELFLSVNELFLSV